MGTKAYGAYEWCVVTAQSSTGYIGNKRRAWFDYENTVNSDDTYSLKLFCGIQINQTVTPAASAITVGQYITGTNKTSNYYTASVVPTSAQTKTIGSTFTWSWAKTHSPQTITITSYNRINGINSTENKASKTFTIPAKTSYSVTYNGNAPSGTTVLNVPGSQTKWHGENLTLQTGVPTVTDTASLHYTFKGWATSQANATAGTVAYKPGATYTGNAALTLYAVWKVECANPSIGKITSLRAVSGGAASDEGTRLNISFPWSVDHSGYLNNTGASVIIQYKLQSASSWTTIGTYSLSGASGTFSKTGLTSGAFDANYAYDIQVTLTDAQGNSSLALDVLSGSYFIMDVSPNGYGIGFGTAAPEEDSNGDALTKATAQMHINMNLHLRDMTGVVKNIFDIFYPVGSYYETSDANFDPEDAWGGSWILETAGLVHVSGATNHANYPVSSTYTDANNGAGQQQGGNKDAIIPYHRHNVAEKATGGPSNNTSGGQSQGHTHSPSNATNFMYYDSDVSGANVGRRNIGSGSGSYYTWTAAKTDALKASAATSGASQGHTHSLQNHTHTLGQHYTDYEGTNGNRTNANMQPYINIYRWHRVG